MNTRFFAHQGFGPGMREGIEWQCRIAGGRVGVRGRGSIEQFVAKDRAVGIHDGLARNEGRIVGLRALRGYQGGFRNVSFVSDLTWGACKKVLRKMLPRILDQRHFPAAQSDRWSAQARACKARGPG